ncbi:MAG: FAD-dependent oxidoreductase [Thermodesulfobacteriota bacterium]
MKMERITEKWDCEADVVVVGYGGAGAVTAITAHDLGAEVLILEKMREGEEGGNTRVSAGLWLSPSDAPAFLEYLRALDPFEMLPDRTREVFAEELVKNREWMEGMGAEIKEAGRRVEHPEAPGTHSIKAYVHKHLNEESLWRLLKENVEQRGITVRYEAPAKKLIRNDGTGEIIGVQADNAGGSLCIKARKAVVLACGGYEFNEEMVKNYSPAYPIYFFGTPANSGDGVLMAQEVGANLWHMNNVMGCMWPAILPPNWKIPIALRFGTRHRTPYWGVIFADKYGRRFMNEGKASRHGWGWREILFYDGNKQENPRIPFYIVFDEASRKKFSPISIVVEGYKITWAGCFSRYEWSRDNSKEIENGWIVKADTIDKLAAKIREHCRANGEKMDSVLLEKTVAKFNEYCEAGEDPDFNRNKETLTPIETPPFYAIEAYPGSVNTQGGPKRNEKCQILDVKDQPIPRLYSAGELGSFWVYLYNSGGNIGECLATGRIAGRNAVAERAWN